MGAATLVVPVVLLFFSSVLTIFLKFYPKWYPEVDQQKRHFKNVLFWVLNLFPYAVSAWGTSIDVLYIPFGKVFVIYLVIQSFLLAVLCTLQILRPMVVGERPNPLDLLALTYPSIPRELIDIVSKATQVIDSHERMLVIHGKILAVVLGDPKLSPQTREKVDGYLGKFEREEEILKAYRAGLEDKPLD